METGYRRRPNALSAIAGCLVVYAGLLILLLNAGCATRSAGDPMLVKDTIHAQCPARALKECVVWGGNKFRKRYEYCGCREIDR